MAEWWILCWWGWDSCSWVEGGGRGVMYRSDYVRDVSGGFERARGGNEEDAEIWRWELAFV